MTDLSLGCGNGGRDIGVRFLMGRKFSPLQNIKFNEDHVFLLQDKADEAWKWPVTSRAEVKNAWMFASTFPY